MAFKVRVLLDSISNDQLIFAPILNNMTDRLTQDLTEVTAYGINKAFQDSELAEDFHQVSVVKFEDVKYAALPVAAKDVVSVLCIYDGPS